MKRSGSILVLAVLCLGRIDCHNAADQPREGVLGPSVQEVQGPRQERKNRMVPDFQPFQHPAAKVLIILEDGWKVSCLS